MWGRVVSSLRQKEYTALFTACGDVRKVSLEQENLIVFIEDEYLYNIISGATNIKLLQDTLAEIDNVANIQIKYDKPEDYVSKDLEVLRRKFGNSLKIVE